MYEVEKFLYDNSILMMNKCIREAQIMQMIRGCDKM